MYKKETNSSLATLYNSATFCFESEPFTYIQSMKGCSSVHQLGYSYIPNWG